MADQVEILARAVVRAGGNALLIDSDNKPIRWVPVAEAVASGGAFAVEPKRTLAVFDLDTDEETGSNSLVELGESFAGVIAQESGVSPLWIDSGRSKHLYVYSPAGAESVYSRADAFGLPRDTFRRNGVRPPLSPHRWGLPVGLIGVSVAEALELLGPVEAVKPIPEWATVAIAEGDDGRWNGNRSAMALAIASAMKSAGCGLGDYRAVMTEPGNKGGAKVHELIAEGKDAEAFLIRTWDRAEVYSGGFDSEKVERVRSEVLGTEWIGKSGKTDQAVMIALCGLALDFRTSAPTFGQRRLAEITGINVRTIRKSLSRLCSSGWIRKIEPGNRSEAAGYEIQNRSSTPSPTTVPQGVTGEGFQDHLEQVSKHPVFRIGSGLGKTACLVWCWLDPDEPKSRGVVAGEGRISGSSTLRVRDCCVG